VLCTRGERLSSNRAHGEALEWHSARSAFQVDLWASCCRSARCSRSGAVAAAATGLVYIDISDPAGTIKPRGALSSPGYVQGWGADNGRWNLDFADGKTAHALACSSKGCGGGQHRWCSHRRLQSAGRADAVVQLADPVHQLERYGSLRLRAHVSVARIGLLLWRAAPARAAAADQVSLRYLDVTNAAQPALLGTSKFGDGWAWTPAAGTFKGWVGSTFIVGTKACMSSQS